jgi:hypothetical protein
MGDAETAAAYGGGRHALGGSKLLPTAYSESYNPLLAVGSCGLVSIDDEVRVGFVCFREVVETRAKPLANHTIKRSRFVYDKQASTLVDENPSRVRATRVRRVGGDCVVHGHPKLILECIIRPMDKLYPLRGADCSPNTRDRRPVVSFALQACLSLCALGR